MSAEDDDNDSEFAPGKKIKLENAANSTGKKLYTVVVFSKHYAVCCTTAITF